MPPRHSNRKTEFVGFQEVLCHLVYFNTGYQCGAATGCTSLQQWLASASLVDLVGDLNPFLKNSPSYPEALWAPRRLEQDPAEAAGGFQQRQDRANPEHNLGEIGEVRRSALWKVWIFRGSNHEDVLGLIKHAELEANRCNTSALSKLERARE